MDRVDAETLAEWDAAYGYGHVTPRAWLNAQLLALGARLSKAPVCVADPAGIVLRSPAELAAWVRARYPEFADDALHPAFRDATPHVLRSDGGAA